MMVIGLLAVIGMLCWLIFTFAVYAVPAFVGVSAFMLAHETGAGTAGAIIVGMLTGAATLVFGQRLIASATSPTLRSLVTALFAAPAGAAGFFAARGVAEMGVSDPIWQTLLALAGGAIVAATAWSRFGALARQRQDEASGSAWVVDPR